MPLLMLKEPNAVSSENKFALKSFMLFFKSSISFSVAPTNLSHSKIQLRGTISKTFSKSVRVMLRWSYNSL